jgi:hypothetical protein
MVSCIRAYRDPGDASAPRLQLIAVRMSHHVGPGLVVAAGRIDDERIALVAAHRIAELDRQTAAARPALAETTS